MVATLSGGYPADKAPLLECSLLEFVSLYKATHPPTGTHITLIATSLKDTETLMGQHNAPPHSPAFVHSKYELRATTTRLLFRVVVTQSIVAQMVPRFKKTGLLQGLRHNHAVCKWLIPLR